MHTKSRLLFIVALMLIGLAVATIINVSLNFRDYSIKSAEEKATMTAAIVKDGLTAHMVNGFMDKREYFLNQISSNNPEVKDLWVVRSQNVIKQFGEGLNAETIRDAIDKEVLKTGKVVKKVHEGTEHITLRISIPYKATTANPNCLKCHDVSRGETLGAVSMEFDITNMRNAGMVTILKILVINLVFIIIALILINYYVTPYIQLFSNMQEGIKRAYSGDFTFTFQTALKGDARKITKQLNTLFKKMQETFGNIKHDLATFIPQGCIAVADPLNEAKVIIHELSDIYKFKKTIELDTTKDVVYSRIINILQSKFFLDRFAIYEVNSTNNTRTLIFKSDAHFPCNPIVDENALLCRAFRTKSDVISSEFEHLCQECPSEMKNYVCIPFDINDDYSLVIYILTKDEAEVGELNNKIPSIKNYLEAAKPVIESRLLMAKLRESSLKDGMTGLYSQS